MFCHVHWIKGWSKVKPWEWCIMPVVVNWIGNWIIVITCVNDYYLFILWQSFVWLVSNFYQA
jgi:hypothetical protein